MGKIMIHNYSTLKDFAVLSLISMAEELLADGKTPEEAPDYLEAVKAMQVIVKRTVRPGANGVIYHIEDEENNDDFE